MSEIYALDLDWDFIQHLANPASVEAIRNEGIQPEVLEDELAKSVLTFQIEHIREHGKAASASVIEHEFDQVTISEPQTVIADLLDRVRERYGRNEGRKVLMNLAEKSITDPASIGSDLLQEGKRLVDLMTPRGSTYSELDYEKTIQKYHEKVVKGRGPSYGFKELDEYFYGQLGLTFIVGAPKSYKSWFTVKAVEKNVKDGQFPYLYSLELPANETDMRLRCMTAKVPYWKFLQNTLDPHELQALEESSEILKDWGSYRIEKPGQGHRGVAELVQHARDTGAGPIFIDQLQYIENRRGVAIGATNDTKDYFEVINDLRDLSDEGPIWVVHQFNRSIMGAEAMPEMQQVKGSAAVEECATLALGLWASKDMKKSGVVQLGTLTSRNYGLKSWECQVKMKAGCGIDIIGEVTE